MDQSGAQPDLSPAEANDMAEQLDLQTGQWREPYGHDNEQEPLTVPTENRPPAKPYEDVKDQESALYNFDKGPYPPDVALPEDRAALGPEENAALEKELRQ